jgi:hypothetical protein
VHCRLPRNVGQESFERLSRTSLSVAIRRDGGNRYIIQLPGDEAEQEQRRLVGGVDVVEQQDERPAPRGGAHETADSVEHPEASRLRVADSARQAGQALAQLGQQLGELPRAGADL